MAEAYHRLTWSLHQLCVCMPHCSTWVHFQQELLCLKNLGCRDIKIKMKDGDRLWRGKKESNIHSSYVLIYRKHTAKEKFVNWDISLNEVRSTVVQSSVSLATLCITALTAAQ
jgi:hypothetical protein